MVEIAAIGSAAGVDLRNMRTQRWQKGRELGFKTSASMCDGNGQRLG